MPAGDPIVVNFGNQSAEDTAFPFIAVDRSLVLHFSSDRHHLVEGFKFYSKKAPNPAIRDSFFPVCIIVASVDIPETVLPDDKIQPPKGESDALGSMD